MNPKPPERLVLQRFPTPIGESLIVADEQGVLRAFYWIEYEAALRRSLATQYGAIPLTAGAAPSALSTAFGAYFAGDIRALETAAWATGGTDFQRKVWTALAGSPAGGTLSYAALAAKLGQPTASRAVGLANGRNPICVALPCHRVIGATGDLTGYGGGLERKRWLLRHEGAAFRDTPAAA
jgi:methylated-DNA-[protein]-cysteine S-methyltransferase